MIHTGPISGISTYDGRLVATAGYDNRVILWDASSQSPIGRVYHDHLANQCTFSPDGKLLATASSDYSARVWTLPDMRLQAVLTGHKDDVEMVAFSPDGTLIATCSRDHTIGIFTTKGSCLHIMSGHGADVISVAWSEDGAQLISSSDDGTIRRWDVGSGTELEVLDMGGVETDTVIITADGTIYSGDDEGRISIFRNGTASSVQAHRAGIKRLIYSRDFRLLASLSYDKTLKIWNILDSGGLKEEQSATFPPIVWPRSGAFLNHGTMVFGTFGSTYAEYDLTNDQWFVNDVAPDESINAVAYGQDGEQIKIGDAGICYFSNGTTMKVPSLCNFLLPVGKMVLSAGQTGEIFDVVTGKMVHTHRSPINCGSAFVKDGRLHAVLGAYTGEGIVVLLDEDGSSLTHLCDIPLHQNAVKGVATDNTHIFSVSADGSIAWHTISDFETAYRDEAGHTMIANGCARIKQGVFASVSRDLKLRVWNGFEAKILDTPHKNSIKCVACSGDGRYIASGGYFGMVAIYDVKQNSWPLILRPSASGISSITAVPGRGAFTCSSYDGKLHTISVSDQDN